jgi:choline dehydrogenase-like flavoprotein
MILDGRTLPADARLSVDLCIIGAGPAGLSIAREFANSTVRVCVLESGGIDRESDIDRLGAGESVGYPYHALNRVRARGIGGTSLLWEMRQNVNDNGWVARPLDPLDFEHRPGRPRSGWPLRYQDLEPFYRRAQVISRLGPFAYDTATWERDGAKQLPLGNGVRTVILQRGSQTFAHHVGTLAAADNISLIHHATVTRLVTVGESGRMAEVITRPRPDSSVSVGARLFVLATGGIENARILLLTNDARPSGLGNGNGLVGRYFMERLTSRGGVLTPTDPNLLKQAVMYTSHIVDGTFVQGTLALSADTIRREQLNNAMLWLRPVPKAFASEGVRSALTLSRGLRRQPRIDGLAGYMGHIITDLDQVASTAWHHLRSAHTRPEVFQVAFQAEATPHAESRVMLSETRDRFGLPGTRLDWKIAEDDFRSIRRTIDLVDARLRATGLGQIVRKFGDERPPSLIGGNFHHLGTTRMATDPRLGVVDKHCRVHETENLYVAGSSVFPSAGFANPTLTIVALAVRLADHLKQVLGCPPAQPSVQDQPRAAPFGSEPRESA